MSLNAMMMMMMMMMMARKVTMKNLVCFQFEFQNRCLFKLLIDARDWGSGWARSLAVVRRLSTLAAAQESRYKRFPFPNQGSEKTGTRQ